MDSDKKRLFFAFNAHSPWPIDLPEGRVIEKENRHLTLVFLGEKNYSDLTPLLKNFPHPPFRVGLAGLFSSCRSLPPRHPRVMAWEVDFKQQQEEFLTYHHTVVEWLAVHGLIPEKADKRFTPHVTLCRRPFQIKEWRNNFIPLPLVSDTIHLFESTGYSKYHSLWKMPLIAPIEINEITFTIRAESFSELYWNACIGLSFHFPELIQMCSPNPDIANLESTTTELNALVYRANQEIGIRLKRVDSQNNIKENNGILEWEMILNDKNQ